MYLEEQVCRCMGASTIHHLTTGKIPSTKAGDLNNEMRLGPQRDILENFAFKYILLNIRKFNHVYLNEILLYRYLFMFYHKLLQHRPIQQAERCIYMKHCMEHINRI